jgi:uncharacterized membrane protein
MVSSWVDGVRAGIPVVVLLALIPCVIALWLIRKRRRCFLVS